MHVWVCMIEHTRAPKNKGVNARVGNVYVGHFWAARGWPDGCGFEMCTWKERMSSLLSEAP